MGLLVASLVWLLRVCVLQRWRCFYLLPEAGCAQTRAAKDGTCLCVVHVHPYGNWLFVHHHPSSN